MVECVMISGASKHTRIAPMIMAKIIIIIMRDRELKNDH